MNHIYSFQHFSPRGSDQNNSNVLRNHQQSYKYFMCNMFLLHVNLYRRFMNTM